MSINKVDASGGRLTLQGDYVVHHQENVEFNLEGDRVTGNLKGTYKGDMFITNLRMIFVNQGSSGYNSFSMDFQHIRNVEVKQPVFGANHIRGFVIAEPNVSSNLDRGDAMNCSSGWEGNANFKLNFPKGGAIDFAEKFQKTVKDSLRNRQNGMGAPLPPQQPAFYPPPPMGMAPPPGGYYYPPPPQATYAYQPGFPPQQPGQQPLYTAPTGQAPPPYVPADTNYQTQHQTAGNAKAQEAYMSGHTAYVPTDAPPPYNPNFDPNSKKDQ